MAAAAAGYLIISIILMLLATGTPSDGGYHEHLDDNRGMLAVENISGFGSQLLPGDEVVAVDGQPPHTLDGGLPAGKGLNSLAHRR